jgi:tetratricopeptide (TPR) repeat protein
MADAAQARLERGRILLFQRRYAQAETELSLALAGDVDKTLALYWLAWAQMSLGRLHEAEATAARSIAENPERSEGYHVRAVIKRKQGHLAEAEAAARLALKKDSGTVEYRAELAWILVYRKKPEDALALVDQALQDAPQAVSLHRVRTDCLIQLRRLDDARQSARHTLSIDPEDATSHAQLGNIYFQDKDYDSAWRHYAEALRLDPQYAYARSGLLSTLRHRIWYYRVLVPKNSSQIGRLRGVWFYGLIGAGAAARAFPNVSLAMMIVLMVTLLLALARWYLGATVAPVTTLLLRLNPIGRAALSADERECSEIAAMLLGGAALSFLGAIFGVWHGLFAVGMLLLLLVAPLAKTYEKQGRDRTLREAYTWLLMSVGAFGVAALAQKMYGLAIGLFMTCGAGALAFEFFTNAIGGIMDQFRSAHRK